MMQQWVTVSEAASALNCAESTVRRRAQADKLKSRTNANGRFEVLIEVLDAEQIEEAVAAAAKPTQPPGNAPAFTDHAAPSARADDPADEDDDQDDDQGDPSAQQANNPFLTMVQPSGADDDEADLRKYQRMAGASILLAQKQADEAAEKVAMMRFELNRSRKRGNVAAYAAAVCVAMTLIALVGGKSKPSSAAAAAHDPYDAQPPQWVYALQADIQSLRDQRDAPGTTSQPTTPDAPAPAPTSTNTTTHDFNQQFGGAPNPRADATPSTNAPTPQGTFGAPPPYPQDVESALPTNPKPDLNRPRR